MYVYIYIYIYIVYKHTYTYTYTYTYAYTYTCTYAYMYTYEQTDNENETDNLANQTLPCSKVLVQTNVTHMLHLASKQTAAEDSGPAPGGVARQRAHRGVAAWPF